VNIQKHALLSTGQLPIRNRMKKQLYNIMTQRIFNRPEILKGITGRFFLDCFNKIIETIIIFAGRLLVEK